ncbi:TetR/AcrR family transcriptional regulator [Pseudoalteromonas citrea]|uniref:TetR/AcrR family transcriptional regulator n=1 Tax=Pseudoalteromonas citrea TaxID=43655 RepID=A0A5S3XMN5_9GAMM|nr:TetR/AcrR family transcriptional regulator [Pseudoalteromonas citrea]TMP46579.1 TetR/AcrR family transcriptional regulator [Pseudoalteromonas citrea]TMP57600.1 TetR/AcrR family transcriptional regulator [Pseudoalteromonas citrea]
MPDFSVKQQDILQAAIAQFAQFGLSATTMEGISKAANVSKRTLYKHFPTKDALFDTVVAQLIERITPLTAIQFIPHYQFDTQLKHLAMSALELLNDEDYLTLSRIVIIESMRSKKQADSLNQRFIDCEKAMLQWFKDASNTDCLGSISPEFAAGFFWGALKKLSYWDQAISWKAPLDEAALNELVEQVCNIFCNGVTQGQ